MEHHRQCELERPNEDGSRLVQTSWIPEKFAVKGKWLRLKGEDHWRVVKVYGRRESREVHERSRDFTKQRKASDI